MLEISVSREMNEQSVIVRKILGSNNQAVKQGDVVVEIETSKTAIEIESPIDGFICHTLQLNQEVPVGARLFIVNEESFTDLQIANLSTAQDSVELSSQCELELATPVLASPYKEVMLSNRKQAEIVNLRLGNYDNLSSTIAIDIQLPGARLVETLFLFKDNISDILMHETAKLLYQFPELNAAYLSDSKFANYEHINIGWGFDDGSNLKVLAIQDADQLTLAQFQEAVWNLLKLYLSGDQIDVDILTRSTVTFSDLSNTEACFMIPLINGAQSLILGAVKLSSTEFRIIATFDHRIAEGLLVTRFLAKLKKQILTHFDSSSSQTTRACYRCEKPAQATSNPSNFSFINVTLVDGREAQICRHCFVDECRT